MFCPKCRAEYREDFYKCADCNIDLVRELPPEPEKCDEYEYVNLVNIKTYPSRYEAELAKGLLSANGIDAVVKDGLEAVGGAAPIFELLIKDEDVDEANQILSEINNLPQP